MIHLGTGVTHGYAWTDAYEESVRRHTQHGVLVSPDGGPELELRRTFFAVDHTRPGSEWRRAAMPENRCKSLQHGQFLDALIPYSGRDVVIFTDADMVMQRPFTYEELAKFHFSLPNTVWLGVNGKLGDTLYGEACLLLANANQVGERALLDRLFPGWHKLPVWNCGVIVARVETYRRLYDMARALLPVVESVFEHYAAIQWCLCYCVGRWLKHELLPRTIHAHGHFGLPEDCVWTPGGDVAITDRDNGSMRPAVFRHCLNLTPAKGPQPTKESNQHE